MKSCFCCSKVIIYISERASIIWEISSYAAPFRKTKVLVRGGGSGGVVPLEITMRVCSILPESKPYLRQKYVNRSPLCKLSRKKPYHIQELCFRKDNLTLFQCRKGSKARQSYSI